MLIGSARFKTYSALSAKTRIAREHCLRFFIASVVSIAMRGQRNDEPHR